MWNIALPHFPKSSLANKQRVLYVLVRPYFCIRNLLLGLFVLNFVNAIYKWLSFDMG